jgi:hypothetical protein
LQDPESPAAVLVLRLFGIVFDVMAKYNVKTDDILLPVFPRLISRTQELAAAAKNPSGTSAIFRAMHVHIFKQNITASLSRSEYQECCM